MFFTVCLVLISQTGYPILGGQGLAAPTSKHETQFKELMAELEVASLKFDRFAVMCKGTRSVTWERDGGGSEIVDFRSVYAEDFDKKCRRIMHVGDPVFRDDGRAQLRKYTVLGHPMADCYVETKPDGHIWIVSGGSAVLDKPRDRAIQGIHPFKSVFNRQITGNPFCMTAFSIGGYQGCRCNEVNLAGYQHGRLTGYARVKELHIFRWFFPIPDAKSPRELGVSEYTAFRGGELVVSEQWFGEEHGKDAANAKKRRFQDRTVISWGEQGHYRVPVEIVAQAGNPANEEIQMKFNWKMDDACPAMLFETANVGELPLGQFFEEGESQ